jgi:polyhydroxyalkanoate synthase
MSTKPVQRISSDDGNPKTVRKSLASAGRHGSRLIARSVVKRLKGGRPNPVSLKSMAKPFARFTLKFATQPDAIITSQMRLVQNSAMLGGGAVVSLISRIWRNPGRICWRSSTGMRRRRGRRYRARRMR